MALKNIKYNILLFALLLLLLDQWSKHYVESALDLGEYIVVSHFFNIRLLYNNGAAFGLLSSAGGWQQYFLSAVALLAIVFIVIWLLRIKERYVLLMMALGLILAGALGNLWDRLTLGYVVDFLDFHYLDYHWPAFNVADSAIVVGVVLLLVTEYNNKAKSL